MYLTLGSLLILAKKKATATVKTAAEGESGQERGSSGGDGMSISSLLGTRLLLYLTAEENCCQRLDRLRSVLECLNIYQDIGSEEGGDK